ncbi:MAG TPA: DNA alkylation repair protein [Caulobacteraceae bacterium]
MTKSPPLALHPEHAKLLAELRAAARPTSLERHQRDSYGGSGHLFYCVSAPTRRAIAKAWLAKHRSLDVKDFLAAVESLFAGQSHEEKTLAALLVGCHATARREVRPSDIDRWLGQLNGWAEIDALCQNVFGFEQMLAAWPDWRRLIQRLARDQNINKRRAALVLLNAPVHYCDDPRFSDLAFATIATLSGERDILITKAVSWLLRSMVKRRRDEVARYLAEHGPSLPRIAVRETATKLATGTKSGRGRTSSR